MLVLKLAKYFSPVWPRPVRLIPGSKKFSAGPKYNKTQGQKFSGSQKQGSEKFSAGSPETGAPHSKDRVRKFSAGPKYNKTQGQKFSAILD
jgi:hypothetical protein